MSSQNNQPAKKQLFFASALGRLSRAAVRLVCFIVAIGLHKASAQLLINEIDVDTPSSDTAEFIELFDGGSGNTSLDGLILVFFNGNGDISYNAIQLDGFSTDANGYFVVGNESVVNVSLIMASSSLQNGADAVALYSGSESDFPNGTVVTTENLIDAVVYDTDDADDTGLLSVLTPGQPQLNENGGSDKDNHSLQRIPNGSGGPRNTEAFVTLPPTPGSENSQGEQTNQPPQIQEIDDQQMNEGSTLDIEIDASDPEGGNLTVSINNLPGFGSLVDSDNSLGTLRFAPTFDDAGTYPNIEIMVVDTGELSDTTRFTLIVLDVTPVETVLINEIDVDTPGSDEREFIELFDTGIGNADLSNFVVVLYNGSDDASYSALDLNGFSTNSNGFFLIGSAGILPAPDLMIPNSALQNGPDAVALYAGTASDFPNGTPVTTENLIDAVVYDTDDADDAGLLVLLNASQPQLNENGDGDKDNHSLQRIPNGSGGERNSETFLPLPPTPGSANINPDTGVGVEIYEIQGDGLESPYVNQVVNIEENIVTALTDDGFFLQTPDDRDDNNAQTSNGIFVFTENAPDVSVGDNVNVTGEIREISGLTVIGNPSTVTVNSSANAQPEIATLNEHTPSPTQPQPPTEFERFEGMLVNLTNGRVTGPSNVLGEAMIVAAPSRLFREPGIPFPGLANLPVWDANPERFGLDPDGAGLPDTSFAAGAVLTSVHGPLTSDSGSFKLLPTELNFESAVVLRAARNKEDGEATIATQNLFRFFDDLDDPDLDEPVLETTEFANRLAKLSLYIREVLGAPDILAVQEVENENALARLAEKIENDAPGTGYNAYLLEGNDPTGIDVGFMVRNSVEVDSVVQIGLAATFDFAGTSVALHDRLPLVLYAKVELASTLPLAVMVVHNRSQTGIAESDSLFVRAKRHQQAVWQANWIQAAQIANPATGLVVLGDFNAPQFTDGYVDVLGQITGFPDAQGAQLSVTPIVDPPLTNQVLTLMETERYTFIEAGNAQALDHILTSASLDAFVKEVVCARGNADAPKVLEAKPSTPMRSSDHDGIVLYLSTDQPDAVEGPAFAAPPSRFALQQNYPNPFNPETFIRFQLPETQHVRLEIYNAVGQRLRTLVDQSMQRGRHSLRWNGRDALGREVPSGIYFYRLNTTRFEHTRKMILLR